MVRIRGVLAVLALAVLSAGCRGSGEGVSSVPPRPSATAASAGDPASPTWTAIEVVDDPASLLTAYAERPGRPEVAAAVWRRCLSPKRCTSSATAVVVSDDGFRTRTILPLPTDRGLGVRWVGADSFLVSVAWRPQWLVGADGTMDRAEWSRRAGPLAAGETLVRRGFAFYGLDVSTATAHPLAAPQGLVELTQDDARLFGVSGRRSFVWSRDGGRSWSRAALPEPHGGAGAMWLAPLVTATDVVLIETSDGATLAPYVAAHRTQDPASGWETVPGPADPTAYVWPVALLPDRRLLLTVESWSDQRRRHDVRTAPGIWVSTDPSWRRLARIRSGEPFRRPEPMTPQVLSLTTSGDGVRLVAVRPGAPGGWASTDLGRHWVPLTAR